MTESATVAQLLICTNICCHRMVSKRFSLIIRFCIKMFFLPESFFLEFRNLKSFPDHSGHTGGRWSPPTN